MKTELYTSIRDILLTVRGVNSVKIWNNGIMDNLDTLGRFPLVFLQFTGLDYETINGNSQECSGAKVTTHILYKTLDGEDTGIFDLSQSVFTAMHHQGFNRINEIPNYSGGEIIDWQITFDAPRFTDDAARKEYARRPKPPVEIN